MNFSSSNKNTSNIGIQNNSSGVDDYDKNVGSNNTDNRSSNNIIGSNSNGSNSNRISSSNSNSNSSATTREEVSVVAVVEIVIVVVVVGLVVGLLAIVDRQNVGVFLKC